MEEHRRRLQEFARCEKEIEARITASKKKVHRIQRQIGASAAAKGDRRAASKAAECIDGLGTALHHMGPVLEGLLKQLNVAGAGTEPGDKDSKELSEAINSIKSMVDGAISRVNAAAAATSSIGGGGISGSDEVNTDTDSDNDGYKTTEEQFAGASQVGGEVDMAADSGQRNGGGGSGGTQDAHGTQQTETPSGDEPGAAPQPLEGALAQPIPAAAPGSGDKAALAHKKDTPMSWPKPANKVKGEDKKDQTVTRDKKGSSKGRQDEGDGDDEI